jgi:hypothetical protein
LFANAFFAGALLIALSGLATACIADRAGSTFTPGERSLVPLVFGWGVLWWLAAGVRRGKMVGEDEEGGKPVPTAGPEGGLARPGGRPSAALPEVSRPPGIPRPVETAVVRLHPRRLAGAASGRLVAQSPKAAPVLT